MSDRLGNGLSTEGRQTRSVIMVTLLVVPIAVFLGVFGVREGRANCASWRAEAHTVRRASSECR